jgi:hypothetical protein
MSYQFWPSQRDQEPPNHGNWRAGLFVIGMIWGLIYLILRFFR